MMCSSGQSEKAGAHIEAFIYPAKNEIPEFEASRQRTNGDAGDHLRLWFVAGPKPYTLTGNPRSAASAA